jgi:6-pyruvoyltetrahydropterin/6-carboxytetrahydropterin synthase
MAYQSTKQYGHEIGLSTAFRQHKAGSHCHFLHGYALAVKFTFEAAELDRRNWVVDFGSMKGLKAMLEGTFDHKLLVAEDDPYKDELCALAGIGVADVVVVEKTGCEAFAELIYECAEVWLKDNGFTPRCRLVSVEVKEHGANSAIFTRD